MSDDELFVPMDWREWSEEINDAVEALREGVKEIKRWDVWKVIDFLLDFKVERDSLDIGLVVDYVLVHIPLNRHQYSLKEINELLDTLTERDADGEA